MNASRRFAAASLLVAGLLVATVMRLPAEVLHLEPGTRRLPIASAGLVLEDPNAGRDHATVRESGDDEGWRPIESDALPAGFSRSAFWTRHTVHTSRRFSDPYYLEIASAQLRSATLYVEGPDGALTVQRSGDSVRADDRSVVDLYPAFRIAMPAPGRYTLHLRIESDSFLGAPLFLSSSASYLRRRALRETAVSMLLGGFLVAMVYAAARAIAKRDALFAAVLAYLLLMFVGIWTGFGDAARLIAPRRLEIARELFRPSFFFASALVLQITYRVLADNDGTLRRAVHVATGLVGALAPAALIWGMSAAMIWILAGTMLVHVVLVGILLALHFRGSRSAQSLSVSWLALLVFPLGSIGARVGLFGYSWVSEYAFVLAIPVHAAFLIRACAQRDQTSTETETEIAVPENAVLEARLTELMECRRIYTRLGLTEAELADECGVTRHELSVYLNRHVGKGFYSYLDSWRVPHACELLRRADGFSMLETAYEVGYNSKTTFNRRFKQHTGVSPREYRRVQVEGAEKALAKTAHSIE